MVKPFQSDTGPLTDPGLAALVSSRICHDLINPIGAIGNGLELLALSAGIQGPEFELAAQSVRSASDRIGYFRLAFGPATTDEPVPLKTLRTLGTAAFRPPRFRLQWTLERDFLPRREAKAVLLILLCLESSLTWGGDVGIAPNCITGQGKRVKVVPELWRHLNGRSATANLLPSQVQFALAGQILGELGWSVVSEFHPSGLTITFGQSSRDR